MGAKYMAECEICGKITCEYEEVIDKTDGNTIVICYTCLEGKD